MCYRRPSASPLSIIQPPAIPAPFPPCAISLVVFNLLPHLLDLLALLLGRLTILPRLLEALRSQAHVDAVLGIGAVSSDFPYEPACVAFVEGGDNVCAVWEALADDCGVPWWRRTLLHLLCVQVGMHCDRKTLVVLEVKRKICYRGRGGTCDEVA